MGNSTPPKISTNDGFMQKVDGLLHQLRQPLAKSKHITKSEAKGFPTHVDPEPTTPSTMAMLLAEFTELAGQIARTDKMIAQVTDDLPDGDEAKRWHEISLQALRCSRDMLTEKQACYLVKLQAEVSLSTEPKEFEKEVAAPEPALEAPTWMGWSKVDIEACPEFKPPVSAAIAKQREQECRLGAGSLRQSLLILRERHPHRVLIVRKIKKLGFESPQVLKKHFCKYGDVEDVLVAHSNVKATPKRPNRRVRPAALGFVVMCSEEGVRSALEAGETQAVGGSVIEVSSFVAFEDIDFGARDAESKLQQFQ